MFGFNLLGTFRKMPNVKEKGQHQVPPSNQIYQVPLEWENIQAIRGDLIAFDVETTGLNEEVDRIIELGAVKFHNGKPVESFSSLVNPGVAIPEKASKISHITNQMVQDAPNEQQAVIDFLGFIGDAAEGKTIMGAHNGKFEFTFLERLLERGNQVAQIRYIDTLLIARKQLKGVKNYKLATLKNYFQIETDPTDRAVDDAYSCGEILLQLVGKNR